MTVTDLGTAMHDSARPAHISPAEWTARVEWAACYRIFDHLGWIELSDQVRQSSVEAANNATRNIRVGAVLSTHCGASSIKKTHPTRPSQAFRSLRPQASHGMPRATTLR